jgi:hypothetical protein
MSTEFSRTQSYLDKPELFAVKKPSITGFTRLETQPTAIGLKAGLQAAIADPLWMLARQWQFNEFQGEDAGSPIKLGFEIEGKKVDHFKSGHEANWHPLGDGQAPIETRVEAEQVWECHPRLRGEAGLQLLRMISNTDVQNALRNAYPLELIAPSDPEADQAGLLWSTLFHARALDAKKLEADLLPLFDGSGKLAALPAALSIDEAEVQATLSILESWFGWLMELVYEGAENNPSWQKNRMEYAFALRSKKVMLTAEGYSDGHVDWEDFVAELVPPPSQGAKPDTKEEITHLFKVTKDQNNEMESGLRHPSPVRYPGMPAERYWEFEDGRVNFAGAEAGVTDLLRLSVTEFALSFGSDWFITPVRLPVGWLYKVIKFEVTDTFGVTSPINAIKPVANNTPWTMFQMSKTAALGNELTDTVFLPDSLDGVFEGTVLEQTLLVRDEMANLAWAIEKTVQGVSGEPLDRDMEAKSLAFHQQLHFDKVQDSPQLVYRLATPVPANWTPLLPVRKNGLNLNAPLEIQLERAGMKRFYPAPEINDSGEFVDQEYVAFLDNLDEQNNFISNLPIDDNLRAFVFYPRGRLLRSNPMQAMSNTDTLVIEEEEVPRSGVILKRKFQYARSSDGKSWLWIGRSKVAGRGEAQSNLRFDVAVKTSTIR